MDRDENESLLTLEDSLAILAMICTDQPTKDLISISSSSVHLAKLTLKSTVIVAMTSSLAANCADTDEVMTSVFDLFHRSSPSSLGYHHLSRMQFIDQTTEIAEDNDGAVLCQPLFLL